MIRTVLLHKADELYLAKCAQEHKFSYGIIVGHQAELNKSVVVHMARNNEEDADLEDLSDVRLTISDINSQALASQWLSASKMCPGSFDVIGIFISSVRPDVASEDSAEFKNAKKLFSDVYDTLLKSSKTFGVYTTDVAQTDFVFLAYSLANKKVLCKNYSYGNGGIFTDMEHRFVEKPFEWIPLECNFDMDDVIPINDPARRINIEEQFQNIIVAMRSNLMASEVFLQNEMVEDTIELQAYIKKKKTKEEKEKNTSTAPRESTTADQAPLELLGNNQSSNSQINGAIRASIVLPLKCHLNNDTEIKVREFNGSMRMSGILSTRIYCNPRNSIADVKRFLRDDVLRSLVTRIQVYCDGLTDPHVTNEAIYISEPPRRVYFTLPSDSDGKKANSVHSPVQFSEYLFRGEAPTVVVAQAKQILDIELDPETIVLDAEGLPDDANFLSAGSGVLRDIETQGMPSSMPKRELSRSLYMLGISVALLVLLVSVALHFALNGQQ
ncbi:protein odr-4 homolog isoform X1 [Scaptodrosophila lebanonensis]|uniref:Protein odr-4 homolog isoform X1 n=1 Tax=Drosophila lebanonensis TaxID=7225 RepID=A0A6J2UAG5_DROLE|nr:protein odr-4 homolog isoform X1 [Scaptodrosophila lebanonensis]